jgi:hypothetical protein
VKRAALVVSGLGAAVMAAFVLWKTAPWQLAPADSVFGVVALGAFVVSPYAAFLLAAALSLTKAGSGVVLALSLVATGLGTVVYADAFLRHESPAYALLFVSIPVLQWGLGVAAIVAAVVLRRRRTDREDQLPVKGSGRGEFVASRSRASAGERRGAGTRYDPGS